MKTTAKRRITGIGAVAMTEFSDLDPGTLHLVRNAANGFPALLAKSLAGEVAAAKSEAKLPREVRDQVDAQRKYRNNARRQRARDGAVRTQQQGASNTAPQTQKDNDVKKQKKAKIRQVTTWPAPKSTQLRKEMLAKGAVTAVFSRIGELEGQLRKAGGAQKDPGIAFLLNRELGRAARLMKGVPSLEDVRDVASYLAVNHPARSEAQRASAASSRAVSGAQGAAMNHMGPFFARDQISDIVNGRGGAVTLNTNDLPSLVEIHRLEKELRGALDSKAPGAMNHAAQLGYELTRKQLLRGHMLGEC